MNKGPEDFKTPCLIHSLMRDAEYQMQAFLEQKTLRWLKDTVYLDVYDNKDKKYISDFFQ